MSDHRREYLRKWRQKNKAHIKKYFFEYVRKNKDRVPSLKRMPVGVDLNKHSTNSVGRKYELVALEKLFDSKDMNENSFCGSYDIEWRDMKVEVKMRNRNKRGYWHFTFKDSCKATHCLLFCVVPNEPEQILFLPWNGERSITVNQSKLDRLSVFFHGGGLVTKSGGDYVS